MIILSYKKGRTNSRRLVLLHLWVSTNESKDETLVLFLLEDQQYNYDQKGKSYKIDKSFKIFLTHKPQLLSCDESLNRSSN